MNYFTFIILSMTTGVMIVSGLRRPSGVLSYPFLVGAVMAGWFLPQAYNLRGDLTLPENGYWITMLYATACIIALKIGWEKSIRLKRVFKRPSYSYNKLLFAWGILSLVGISSYSQIFNVDVQTTQEGYSTGIVTILFFFAKLQYFGFALA